MPDNVSRKAFRTETPNLIDDWGLKPYAYRLYGHYRRWCGDHGTYNKTLRDTAKLIEMSPAQVMRARQQLLDQELIVMEPDGSVRVTDIWDLNKAWFVSIRNKNVSLRDKLVAVKNKAVSIRNKLFQRETSLYRKNSLERTIEDTATTRTSGGGGGGHHTAPLTLTPAPTAPRSAWALEQIEVWAESLPDIIVPDKFAHARWLDGLADRRISRFYAQREAELAPPLEVPCATGEPERLPGDLEAEVVQTLAGCLEMGWSLVMLDEQFSPGIPSDQWTVMRAAAIDEFRRRGVDSSGDRPPQVESQPLNGAEGG